MTMPTLLATPWPGGPVVVSTPLVQRYSGRPGLAVELAEAPDVVQGDGRLAEHLVLGVDRLDPPQGSEALYRALRIIIQQKN
jgi:hypothetical protein